MSKSHQPALRQPLVSGCFNLDKFAEIMTLYRVNHRKKSLRDAAQEIGISASTLNRIEMRKQLPDIETYYKCCKWCQYGMEWFFKNSR